VIESKEQCCGTHFLPKSKPVVPARKPGCSGDGLPDRKIMGSDRLHADRHAFEPNNQVQRPIIGRNP
jgi:hypothetical protein